MRIIAVEKYKEKPWIRWNKEVFGVRDIKGSYQAEVLRGRLEDREAERIQKST